MAFSVANLVRKAPAAPSKFTSTRKLLEKYAEYDINTSNMAKGERGIVVISLSGDEPIYATVEEYYTGDGNRKSSKRAKKGLAGTASQYQVEQTQLAALTAEARNSFFKGKLPVVWELSSLFGKEEEVSDEECYEMAEEFKTPETQSDDSLARHKIARASNSFVRNVDKVSDIQGYEMKDLVVEDKAQKTKTEGASARSEPARESVDLSTLPLHHLIPGLEFLPGIDSLNRIEVGMVQVEYRQEPLPPVQSYLYDDERDLEEIYSEYESLENYVYPSLFATDAQKQDSSDVSTQSLNDSDYETRPQLYHTSLYGSEERKHSQAVYFYDSATGRAIGFTVMNLLLHPPERERQLRRAGDDCEDEDLEVAEFIYDQTNAGLEDFVMYFDDNQPDGLNPVLYEDVQRDAEEELYAGNISDDVQPMMYSSYYEPPRGSKSIYREPPELRGPMRRPVWKALDDTMLQIAEVMTPPAHFVSFSWSQLQLPDYVLDAEAVFDGDVWRNNVLVELSFPISETQRTHLLKAVETSSALPNSSSDAGDAESLRPCNSKRICFESVHGFDVTAQAITDFTMDYVSQIRECNAVHMLVTRARIMKDQDSKIVFGFGEKSMNDMALFVQALYKASSASAAGAQDAVYILRILLDVVVEVAGSLEYGQQDIEIQTSVERMWETTFSCMDAIESAHEEMLTKPGMQLFKQKLADEVAETERLVWGDWLRNMGDSAAEEGEGSKTPSVIQQFSWSSALWWHAKICEAIRRLDGHLST
ncbi:uncharacterized protein N0V89_002719 [Didymosphaeria variabile]|uniref:Uncharacterized protein n=1 Tax=Didymosphaeria variabile TaxID=1932322 RepID=A0A9W8XUU3_9PLEO|nr:uncharacterized protein N0V89_002719 [Didymosphaeria variabile]KAJ4358140.1 hypothetical protein N0V89_002719 [Didymosphaeria variabile]